MFGKRMTRRIRWLRLVGFPDTLCPMSTTTKRIADKVRGVSAEHRFTQQRIAECLGISRTSVVERFNGRVPFTATELFDLASAMNVPVSRFYPEAAPAEVAA